MEDILLVDAAERYLRGEMSAEERKYFEELRKNNPDLDQTVVEQMFFLQELSRYADGKAFRHSLSEIESRLNEEGLVGRSNQKGPARIITWWQRSRKTISVAASIASIISLLSIAIFATLNNKEKKENLKPLVDKIKEQDRKLSRLDQKIGQINSGIASETLKPRLESKFRATGFLVDAQNNLIVTNAHVIREAVHQLIIENKDGVQYLARPVYVNPSTDIAIIRVIDSNFKKQPALPYAVRKTNAELGEHIFMLGFPKQEIVYGEGYVSAKNGYQLDTIFCQLNTAANEGNSGSPVFNRKGEVIGVITSMETNAEGVVYAIKSSHIHHALEELKKQDSTTKTKLPSSSGIRGLEREEQIRKVEDYVYMIKGN